MAAPSVTYTFSNSTTADATQVNTNFTDLVNSLSDGLKDLTISSLNTATLTVSGAATFNGTVALGNATTDDVTITGYIASDILPKTTGTASLGSATQAWEDIYLDEGATNGGTIYFDAGTTKYIQSNAAGTILTIGGFTSMVPPAAINAAGALTIGTNGSTTALTLSTAQVATFAGDIVLPSSGNIYPGDTTSQLDLFGGSNTTSGTLIRINGSGNGGSIVVNTGSGTTALTINSSQSVIPAYLLDLSTSTAGQIKFPASQNASADANTLDDYEEGTWTPSVGGTATYSTQSGIYTKVGSVVYVQFWLICNGGAGTGQQITGLPFTVINSRYGVCFGNLTGIQFNGTAPMGEFNGGTTAIVFYGFNNNAGYGNADFTTFASGDFIQGSGFYTV